MTTRLDPVALTQALIRQRSVTPEDGGAIAQLQKHLDLLGFACTPLTFQSPGKPAIKNLYASIGAGRPHFCFAGHTDVVPPGSLDRWHCDPFAAEQRDGMIVGRGAVDMKGAIAAFVCACDRFLKEGRLQGNGTISLLITGDEEGEAVDGTVKVLGWMESRGVRPDFCVVGEPTSRARLGDMIKVGRRGSLTGRLTVKGKEGHVAYPHLADNPIPVLLNILSRLIARRFADANEVFDATNLEIVTIDVGNLATNVIPAEARATFNIRFNTHESGMSLTNWLRTEVASATHGQNAEAVLDITVSGEPFLTAPGPLQLIALRAVEDVTGVRAELSTTGGTSDARFIAKHFPVIEFGLVGQTMHKADEGVAICDLHTLQDIYHRMLVLCFAEADT